MALNRLCTSRVMASSLPEPPGELGELPPPGPEPEAGLDDDGGPPLGLPPDGEPLGAPDVGCELLGGVGVTEPLAVGGVDPLGG